MIEDGTTKNLGLPNLRNADLSSFNLRNADLRNADLSGSDLRNADLRNADLRGSDLRNANLTNARLSPFQICPQKGAFIAYKALGGHCVAELQIPEAARRTSTLIGRKCRASEVKVLSITNRYGQQVQESYSKHDPTLAYKVGERVIPDSYDDDVRIECSNGIHFFVTREETKNY